MKRIKLGITRANLIQYWETPRPWPRAEIITIAGHQHKDGIIKLSRLGYKEPKINRYHYFVPLGGINRGQMRVASLVDGVFTNVVPFAGNFAEAEVILVLRNFPVWWM